MARLWFGGTTADYLFSTVASANRQMVALATGTVTVTFWDSATGGTQYIDLLDASGSPITQLVVTGAELPRFQGPDGIAQMWADAGDGRVVIVSPDGATNAAASATAAAASAASVNREQPGGVAGLDGSGLLYASRVPDLSGSYLSGAAATAWTAAQQAQAAANFGELLTEASRYSSTQAAINAAPAGGIVLIAGGNSTTMTAPLTLNKAITLLGGGQMSSRLVFDGCDGIQVAAGVNGAALRNLEIAQATRYTTTTNAYNGINVQGTSSSYIENFTVRDVYVDGFQTAILTQNLWSSTIDNLTCGYGLYGIDAYGLSENNFVSKCKLSVGPGTSGGISGSRGIRLNGYTDPTRATTVGSEGWVIADTLTYAADIGVETIGYANFLIHDCILDFNQLCGIKVSDNGTNAGGNADIHDNYIAINGTTTQGAIELTNTVSNSTIAKNRVHHNELVGYPGSSGSYGIHVLGNNATSVITENTIQGFASAGADIFTQVAGNIIANNVCLSGAQTFNISRNNNSDMNIIYGNVGSVLLPGAGAGAPAGYIPIAGRKHAVGLSAPTSGTWVQGDLVVSATPTLGGPRGWRCTAGGSPGAWQVDGYQMVSGAPTAAAGANAGTSPPVPVVTSGASGTSGNMTFGTGASPAAGAMVTVTYATAYVTATPMVRLNEASAATKALGLYVSARSLTGFTISAANSPAASQPNTTYSVDYAVAL